MLPFTHHCTLYKNLEEVLEEVWLTRGTVLKLLYLVMTMARGLSVEMMSVANKGTLKTTLANMEGFLEGIVEFQFNFFLVQRGVANFNSWISMYPNRAVPSTRCMFC